MICVVFDVFERYAYIPKLNFFIYIASQANDNNHFKVSQNRTHCTFFLKYLTTCSSKHEIIAGIK